MTSVIPKYKVKLIQNSNNQYTYVFTIYKLFITTSLLIALSIFKSNWIKIFL